MSGPTTSSRPEPMMDGNSACLTSSTSSPGECLAIRIDRKLNSISIIDALTDLFILRGVPAHIRSDNGPEFIATAVREWIVAVGAKTAFIEPGSPWENGYCESFNARLRRRTPERRDLLLAGRGQCRDRKLAEPLQYGTPALIAGLPSAGTTGRSMAGFAIRTTFAGHASLGAKANSALRFALDHSMGAGQPR